MLSLISYYHILSRSISLFLIKLVKHSSNVRVILFKELFCNSIMSYLKIIYNYFNILRIYSRCSEECCI
nr:MAG TPA: hypothetical protein [Bacteriophage sp.]